MATSPNFNWPEPDNTDLVKNGALAIRTAVNAIDSSLVDLKGGTTGQVLAKASGTDMDFSWVAQDDANAIQNTQLTAKGALISAVSAGTPATLTVGTNNQVLTADSTTATGLKWVTPAASGGANWSLLNAGGTALSGSSTVTVSGISAKDQIMVILAGASTVTASYTAASLRLNTDSGSNYGTFGPTWVDGAASGAINATAATEIAIARTSGDAASTMSGFVLLSGCNAAGVKVYNSGGGVNPGSGAYPRSYVLGGYYTGSSTISSISIVSEAGNFDAGTVYVYTSA
jgi:hypothetical protein